MSDFLLATYILGIVFWGGLFAVAVWRFGGFQGYTDFCNNFFREAEADTEITSNQLQWRVVLYTLAWPLIIPIVVLLVWSAKKGV